MAKLNRTSITLRAFLLLLTCITVITAKAGKDEKVLLQRITAYGKEIASSMPDSIERNVYRKCFIDIKRRNFLLLGMPTMFFMMKDNRRKAVAEAYEHEVVYSNREWRTKRNIWLSTVYHGHTVLYNLLDYIRPQLYDTEIFYNKILSPLNSKNYKYYSYEANVISDSITRLSFKSKRIHTELIRRGHANIVTTTGRIIDFSLEGESDMNHFTINGEMANEGANLLLPRWCKIDASIKFMGNHIDAIMDSYFDMPETLADTINDSHDLRLMERLRPKRLTTEEQDLIKEYYPREDTLHTDTIKVPKKKNWAKIIFWDIIGDNILNDISTHTADDKGYMRIAPILNPLYFGYSHRKGLYYKVDIKGGYTFNSNRDIYGRLKMGYSFKQKQLFYSIPIIYNFNKNRFGFVRLEISNGSRITDSRVLDNIKAAVHRDTINWERMNLDYFKDTELRFTAGYDILYQQLSLQGGISIHRRSAIDKTGFLTVGRPSAYQSIAPFISVSWYPFTRYAPLVFTAQYEHGIKVLGGNILYSRIETDLQYIGYLPSMRLWSLRVGAGGYLNKKGETYFLSYYNFHENYIPNGWRDDWSGEFEMLNANWYNASNFYVRANFTYESPLLVLSWLPWVGRVIEKERIYVSMLGVKYLCPYTEVGYSFTNRVFSMGIFTGFSQRHYEGIGVKFGFELFSKW